MRVIGAETCLAGLHLACPVIFRPFRQPSRQGGRTGLPADELRRQGHHAHQVVRQHEQAHHAADFGQAAHRHSQQAAIARLGIHAFGRCRTLLVDLFRLGRGHALAPLGHRFRVVGLGLVLVLLYFVAVIVLLARGSGTGA